MTSKEMVKLLKSHGFVEIRQTGSHKVFNKGEKIAVVPFHNKDLSKGTERSILKLAGLL